jgi:3-hydroxybutyryl-CoA dehydrogenase
MSVAEGRMNIAGEGPEPQTVIAVVGAGTMGAGIAQVAAVAGHPVLIHDARPGAADGAVAEIRDRVKRLVAKGRIDVEPDRLDLTPMATLGELGAAGVVIEAVVEDLEVKRELFSELERIVEPGCLLASNTSSLSPTALAAGLVDPGRVVGLHFFNPVPLMSLVEVVPGLATREAVTDRAAALVTAWGKTVVRSTPTPGFIVNRVARAFYGEAWRVIEERAAAPATVDAVLTGAGGFRMGPFALMDLIGHDVNEAVTRQVWAAFDYDTRFTPSLAQRALVEAGRLGRKSGRGVYDYDGHTEPTRAVPAPPSAAPTAVGTSGPGPFDVLLGRAGIPVRPALSERHTTPHNSPGGALDSPGATHDSPSATHDRPGATHDSAVELPGGALVVRCNGTSATELAAAAGLPVIVVDRTLDDATATAVCLSVSDGCPDDARDDAIGLLQAAGLDVYPVDDTPGLIVTRTVAMLVNLAVDAVHRGVAGAADVDTAMVLGTNYPLGPLAWGDRWGATEIDTVLTALTRSYGETRYRPSVLLARRARSGHPLAADLRPERLP